MSTEHHVGPASPLPLPEVGRPPLVVDQIFERLYQRVVTLALPPGTRLTEAGVAQEFGVSRQPVRDAFYRLSKLGLLSIRPQRATMVTTISEEAVMRACFIRTAIEAETVRAAAAVVPGHDSDVLDAAIAAQRAAVAAGDRDAFHALDDDFHRLICEQAGLGFAWELIRDNKAHMDRVRYLSLSFGAELALDDHETLLAALKRGDAETATATLRRHLGRIGTVVRRLREDEAAYFTAS
jgi:GntR family transcriptional regulator, rspAB operon transcriptional repressor